MRRRPDWLKEVLAWSRGSLPLITVAAIFVGSRVVVAAVGVRFDDTAIHPHSSVQAQWQLLPTHLLQHDLLRSVWYLHSQPPLYNLFAGGLLHLPSEARQPIAAIVFMLLGLLLVVTCFFLVVELGVGHWIAAAVAVIVTLDPATLLYENWLSWSYPTAVFMVMGFYGALRLLKSEGRVRWAVLSASSFVCVVLLDSTFQWPWLALVVVIVGVSARRHWRRVLAGAAIPLSLVSAWYVKDAVLFGTVTTSSWAGMNLAQITTFQAPPGQVPSLVARHTLTRLAEIPPFAVPKSYVPRFVATQHHGVPALDDQQSDAGSANFNNLVYVPISDKYLHEALAYVVAEPGTYAGAVQRSVGVWMLPADQYSSVTRNYGRISGYARAFDAAVLIQPSFAGPQTGKLAEIARRPPHASEESWTLVFLLAFLLLGAPVALRRLRRRDAPAASVGLIMWLTVLYSFVVTSLLSIGENNRFRFELGPVPVVLLLLTVHGLLDTYRSRDSSANEASGEPYDDLISA